MKTQDPNPNVEALWRDFHERLRAFVSRRVPRAADVDDILQEVFLRVHRGADSIRERERLAAWIFQITRNVIVDHFRAGSGQPETVGNDFDPQAQADTGADERNELAELSTCIEPMIAALPGIYREAIRLTDLNGATQVEAARRFGVSVSGMKSRVRRARLELKTMLLECCRIELDRRGGIADCSVRDARKSPCGPCGRS